GGAFNVVMQSSLINLFFAILFGFFGLAMLGLFDFTVGGEDFTSRVSSAIGQRGGLFSTFLLGVTAGLIISPCVGPVVFTLLLQIADRIAEVNAALIAPGSEVSFMRKSLIAAQGGLMMGGFGIGIGIPLLLVGFLSNRLPKAGKWMEYVKYSLGLIILYLAWVYFMKGIKAAQINDRAAYTILAGNVSLFFSISFGLFRTEKNRIKKGIALFLLLPAFYFMYNGLSQAGIITIKKEVSHTLAPVTSLTKDGYKIEKHENLEWYRDFEEAKRVALKGNEPIFLDFFAYWCANCLEFEKLSVKNEKLNQSLQNAVLVKIYDTDPIFKTFKDNPTHRELKRGLPYFAILRPNGEFFWKGTQYDAVETMSEMIKAASAA
ncbi:MAG: cytochrome c biogenesis protein CcdA, partial [Nitrospinota bacterium]|nr:cytochrome c biogenesis protein CcdA [Nitrospinota bacterium]